MSATAVHKFVSPFLDDTVSSSGNSDLAESQMVTYPAAGAAAAAGACYFNASAGAHHGAASPQHAAAGAKENSRDNMGLRAASHVSMPDTAQAHEYNPTCACGDCSWLLHNMTSHDLLDAYVRDHLAYEQQLQHAYGFVPCVGGPHGNVALRLDPATGRPHPKAAPETSTSLFFFFHLHTMKPVTPEVRHRSLQRYYDPAAAAAASSAPAAAPASGHHFASHRHAHQHQQHFGAMKQPFRAHQHHRGSAFARGFNHHQQQQQHDAAAFHPHAAASGLCYTAEDVMSVRQSAAFTEAAVLGN